MNLSALNKLTPQKDYPYMNARVSAKGAKLLEKQDYQQLTKMGENEISRKLEEKSYEQEINKLGSSLDGTQLIEKALNENLNNELGHLIDISPGKVGEIVNTYTQKIDLAAYKQLIKWKKTGEKQELREIVSPGHKLDINKLKEISEEDIENTTQQISNDLGIPELSKIDTDKDMETIENQVDTLYFENLLRNAKNTGNNSFVKFVEMEIEYKNLSNLVRLKYHDASPEEINQKMIDVGNSSLVERCQQAPNYEEMLKELEESRWRVDDNSLKGLEKSLDVDRREKAVKMMKTTPMGLTSVLAYILAKTIEVENLRKIVQAKKTGLNTREEIMESLVITQ